MPSVASISKDKIGSAMLVALGAGVLIGGFGYQFGTLSQMGAGFIPVVLGTLMLVIGIAIGVTASAPDAPQPTTGGHGDGKREWRGWSCILAGVAAFVLLGRFGGLVPASFVSVFVSALGDRENTFRSAALLAAIVTIFGTAVFYFGLHLQLPLFHWG